MSFSSSFYAEIKDLIETFGNDGIVYHNPTGGNDYDDDGEYVVITTDFPVKYTTQSINKNEMLRFSNDSEMRKVYILFDGVVAVKKGDDFSFNNLERFKVEEVDDVGETQNKAIVYRLWLQRV
jgi:hypothetical protein